MNLNNLTRRQLCKAAVIGIPASILLTSSISALAEAVKLVQGADLKLVPDTDPVAKALGYVADAANAKREKKGNVEGKDQQCSNCQMYTKQGVSRDKEAGKCIMITGGSVLGGGWCKSWVKKA